MSCIKKPVSVLLDPACGVPHDVVFQIQGKSGASLGEVAAHKPILALRVEVFQRQFYGDFPSPTKVPVMDTSLVAFKMLVSHIYQAEEDWTSLNFVDVFLVFDLAEKYLLPCLKKKVLEYLGNSSLITESNLVEAAAVAEDFFRFQDASAKLLDTCALFIKNKMDQDRYYSVHFASQNCSKNEDAEIALRLLARVPRPPKICSNCRLENRQTGQPVSSWLDLADGTRLLITGQAKVGEKGSVVKMTGDRIGLKFDNIMPDYTYVMGPSFVGENGLVFNCQE